MHHLTFPLVSSKVIASVEGEQQLCCLSHEVALLTPEEEIGDLQPQ